MILVFTFVNTFFMSDFHQNLYQIQWQTVNELKSLIHSLGENKDNTYIQRIRELEDELRRLKKSKRYGLVWEDKPEDVVERCKNELPILVEDYSKRVIDWWDDLTHILIEWDNYHALSVLAYTHEKKVDLIYIDPPYNTGATDWKYNNNYVDANDTFRHSKWISMMNNRLNIAKKLLKDDGVLVCAIDENECSHLWVLLEWIFLDYEIHKITVVHNPRWVQGANFSYTNEFLFFVFRRGNNPIWSRKIENDDINWSNLRNWWWESLRSDARNCFYPVIVENDEIVWFWDVENDDFHPKDQVVKKWTQYYVYPIDQKWVERKWRYARQTVEEIIGHLRVKVSKKWKFEIEIWKNFGTVKTVWIDSRYDASEYWSKLIQKVVPGIDFTFPKSLWAVYDSIAPVMKTRRNGVVLDFFAWSGTTWHAVQELNKEDGWKRQFILCTNNENKIAEEVTYPRIRNVIGGYADVEGIPANLRYYRTDFIGIDKSIDDLRGKFMGRCTDMLQVRENTFSQFPLSKNGSKAGWEWESEYFRVFQNTEKLLVVMYHPYEIESFKKWFEFLREKESIIENSNVEVHKEIVAYIFSMGWEIFEEELAHLSDRIRIETIPDEVLETYKKIFGF